MNCCGCLEDYESSGEPYTQCRLVKGDSWQMAWIPSRFAVVGTQIRLRTSGEWDAGWTVKSAHLTRRSHELGEIASQAKLLKAWKRNTLATNRASAEIEKRYQKRRKTS